MLDEHAFRTGSVTINYAEGPKNGPPLVMLHGLSSRWQTYLPIIPHLVERWHIYGLDFRGHGGSDHLADSYTWSRYAADTAQFLADVLSEPAVLLGHSLGAMVAAFVAANHPSGVRALILEEPPLFSYRDIRPTNEVPLDAWRDLAAAKLSLPELEREVLKLQPSLSGPALSARVASLSQVDSDAIAMTLDGRATADFDIELLLPAIACPTLLLRGAPERGGMISDADLADGHALAPAMQIVDTPEVGHLIHQTQPDAFSQRVERFLQSAMQASAELANRTGA
jgi:pimeloyl-ACP methyl ester carboxylesterase